MDLAPKKAKYYTCAVAVCKQRYAEDGITFHKFPRNPARQKAWVIRCKRHDPINTVNARICSRHFLPEHYKADKINTALGLPTKNFLTEDAIPTRYLSEKEDYPMTKTARTERRAKRAAQKEFQEIKLNLANVIKETINNNYEIPDVSEMFNTEQTSEVEQLMYENIAQQLKKTEKLKMKHQILKQKLHQKTLKCHQLVMEKIAIQRLVKGHALTSPHRKTDRVLQKNLPSLSKNTSFKNIGGTWTNLDILNALALRTLSYQSYELVQNKIISLPSLKSLSRWTKSFLCVPGIVNEAMLLLKVKAETIPDDKPCKRLCVLAFDEMTTSEIMVYSKDQDRVYGPAKSVQVVMLRGLCEDYKQVIFYEFNSSMTSEKLAKIIIEVEKVGLNVVALTSDIGGKNQQLWKTLMICTSKTYMLNPVDESRKIWIFHDVPQLLKLLCKHFIDDGITTSTGDVLKKEIIEELLEHDMQQTVKLVHHLSVSDLTVVGSKRQQVFQAARLFSSRTANAILYLTKNNAAFLFFKLVNDVFDVLNSHHVTCSTCPLRSAFQVNDLRQTNTLRKFEQECLRMKCGTRKVMMPFQIGFIISIRSLFGLAADMSAVGLKYILTAKLNQECLDFFFTRVKSLGSANSRPNAFEFQTRLWLLLTKNVENMPLTNMTSVNDISLYSSIDYYGEDLASFVSNKLLIGLYNARSLDVIDKDEDFGINLSGITSKDKFNQESDALLYVAGYVAHRCRQINPSLGSPKDKIPLKFVDKWLKICSYGGLLMPSKSFSELFSQFEILFTSYHGPCNEIPLNQDGGVQKCLIKMISEQYPNIDERIVCCYVNARTYFRINFHNQHIRSNSGHVFDKRKRKKMSFIENL